MKSKAKLVSVVISMVVVLSLLISCAPQPAATEAPAPQQPAQPEATAAPAQPEASAPTEAPAAPAAEGAKKIVIGLSNGYFGTDWRTQHLNAAQQVFDEAKAAGLIAQDSELKIQNAGADTNQQIQQFRNMINEKVDVLMINANSATALNEVIDEAKDAGIPVISFDQAVTNPYAYNVTVDHYAWGKRYAEWLAKALNGKGKVVTIDGLPGHPAAEARKKAAEDVFAQYPDIEILQQIYGMWDQSKAQAATADLLAAFPQIDGVFVEDSMAMGVMRAFQTANRTVPTMTGEATKGYLLMWKDELTKNPDFQSFAQANPPGISGSAMKIAIRVALGRKLKPQPESTFYYPISVTVDKTNIDQVLEMLKDKPETYFLDEWLTDEAADALFE
ncbi:MAG: substrate-binding domain-containing protein [Anaerolineae bacterium]|nr:substrate-binding domain-containing protein [Anaerolineae bacterium]